MVTHDRNTRSRSLRIESLESRNLLSLIGSKPTLDVVDGPGVHHHRGGSVFITQPATIQVVGTAQAGAPGTTTSVSIYAEDSEGNLVNGGDPLATVTPDFLGRYNAIISLPSMIPKDVNFLVARQTSSATQTSALTINPTTISGLNGTISLDPGTLSGLTGSIANPATTLTGIGGTISTPATPISDLAGTITTPAFPITTPAGPGTAGPSVGTLVGGSGTLGAQVGTLAGGTATVPATTSTLTQTGTAAISALTGTFANGTGNIAATTGTSTTQLSEVATSDPVQVVIHQPPILVTPLVGATHHVHLVTHHVAATHHHKK
jgi:hypothetical protein